MPQLRIRYFAAARSAAGIGEEYVAAETVDEALTLIRARHGERLAIVLAASSLLLDGVQVGDTGLRLPADAELDVLPPFAGG